MEMGQIFRKALLAYRNNPKFVLPHLFEYLLDFAAIFIFLLAAVVAIIISMPELGKNFWQLIYYKNAFPSAPFSLMASLIFGVLLLALLMLFFNACARAAIIGMAKESFAKEKTSLSTGAVSMRKFGLDILGFNFIIILIAIALLAAIFLPVVLLAFFRASGLTAIALLLPLFFFASLAVIYVAILFAPQQIVVKELGVLAGMKESYGFVRRNLGAVLIYVAVAIAVIIFMVVLSFLVSLLLSFTKNEFLRIAFWVFENLFSLALGLIIAPYFEIAKTFMIMEDPAGMPIFSPPAPPVAAEVAVQTA